MKVLRKELNRCFVVLTLAVCAASLAVSQPPSDSRGSASGSASRDLRSGFGKPETISGTISAVDHRGVVILKREGPSEPATTHLTVTETPNTNQTGSAQSTDVQASPGPGQTDYAFRITSSTRIRIDGQPKSIADLAGLNNRKATVHFIPRRSGNFVSSIDVSD